MTRQTAACLHEHTQISADVARIEDEGVFMADLRIQCADCGEPFRFLGLPYGLSFQHPALSPDGLELRAPMEPEGEKTLAGHSVFEVPR